MSKRKTSSIRENSVRFSPELLKATGVFEFSMTNDYLFHAVLQKNNYALKGLICALLHLNPSQVHRVTVLNPLLFGEHGADKEYRLDVNILMNDMTIINLEMQVVWQPDWHERSLVYLCSNLSRLEKGQNYGDLKPVIHIGILDHTPREEGTEFYSENMLMNVKNHKIYSDKLSLRMLKLNCIEHATEEDKRWELDKWAGLFRATTWEEVKRIAMNNDYMRSASNSIFEMNADDLARKRCRDREDYYRDIRNMKKQLEESAAIIAQKDALIAELQAKLAATAEQNP